MRLVGVFATSTPYGYWGFAAVRYAMQILYGDVHHIHCLSLDELRDAWLRREGRNVLFTSDCPDAAISDLFISANAPMIAFLDDAEDAIAYAKESRQFNLPQALSLSTQCFCALAPILVDPHVACFPSRHYEDDVRDLFRTLLVLLEGTAETEQLEEVMRAAIFDYRPGMFMTVEESVSQHFPQASVRGEALAAQTAEARHLLTMVANAYRPIFDRKSLSNLVWPRELFFTCNEGYGHPEHIELTGPARCLIWGPYLHLPPGQWIARVEFEVRANWTGNSLEADIYDGVDIMAIIRTELPAEGIFSFELPFSLATCDRRLEIRLYLMKGAIEGQLGLRSVSLWPNAPSLQNRFYQSKYMSV